MSTTFGSGRLGICDRASPVERAAHETPRRGAGVFGGGVGSEPWNTTSDRGVYNRFRERWHAPRRWVRYSGAPAGSRWSAPSDSFSRRERRFSPPAGTPPSCSIRRDCAASSLDSARWRRRRSSRPDAADRVRARPRTAHGATGGYLLVAYSGQPTVSSASRSAARSRSILRDGSADPPSNGWSPPTS